MPQFFQRKHLRHEVPAFVPEGALFFVTVCARVRFANVLATDDVAPLLIKSVAHKHAFRAWFMRLFVVMPDHVHALVAIPPTGSLGAEVASWKRFTAKSTGVAWQDGCFEHRLRPEEGFDAKSRYIRENPVRAGLVRDASEWPWVWAPDAPVFHD
jgi:REP element-mobilizing transposase RayT